MANYAAREIFPLIADRFSRQTSDDLPRKGIMHSATPTFTALFDAIDDPKTLSAQATETFAPPSRFHVNAHIHLPPNFSAFDSVSQAVTLAAAQDVPVLGA